MSNLLDTPQRPCDNYAPDTASPDPDDREVCSSCFWHGDDHTPRTTDLPECGMCHDLRPASSYCFDGDGEYAVCADCDDMGTSLLDQEAKALGWPPYDVTGDDQ